MHAESDSKTVGDCRDTRENIPLGYGIHFLVNNLTYNLESAWSHPGPEFLFSRTGDKNRVKDARKLAIILFVKLIPVSGVVGVVVIKELQDEVKRTQPSGFEYTQSFCEPITTQYLWCTN